MMPAIDIPGTTILATLTVMGMPLAAFAVIMVATRKFPRLSAGISIAAVSASLACAVLLLTLHRHTAAPLVWKTSWVLSGTIQIPFGFQLDPASLLMLVVVAGVSLLVQIYSTGYMAGDPGFGRYYAYMSLFAWAMLSLTLSPNLLQLYIFWELVGVSSYLLIGFWYEKFSASEAGKKAFVMTRFGDVAFMLGILLLLAHLPDIGLGALNGDAVSEQMPARLITLSALLIFGGIVGKSAQFPLMTWLPDAMEGPTPVSALLHSATMVAAGVYLFVRLFPFFSLSPTAMTVFLAVGTVSMLMASTMAMVSRDIKQVWAYSTISQLGFMIMGLAAGSYFSGMFHLVTHAGFKALLFLCAGVFIHAYGGNDMVEIARKGGRHLRVPMACMVVGAAALSGLPPFSGFFSKESILEALAHLDNPVWVAAGLAGAFLMAYYTFRLIFVILLPAEQTASPDDDAGHGHGADRHYRVMCVPLVLLAAATLVLGFFQPVLWHMLMPSAAEHAPVLFHVGWLTLTAVGLAFAGVLLAYVEFGRGARRTGFVERFAGVHRFFAQRWYLDRIYRVLLDRVVYEGVARMCAANDRRVIDDGIDGLCRQIARTGRLLSGFQRGMIQYRLIAAFAVLAAAVGWIVF